MLYQPEAMRWRGVPVHANSPLRSAQRGPGYNQMCAHHGAAARQGGARAEDRPARDPPAQCAGHARRRSAPQRTAGHQLLPEGGAGARAPQIFGWEERLKRNGQRNGSKVTAVGVGQAYHPAGFAGFDGLVRIMPNGKVHIHTGVGNLGTFSHSSTSRIAAEVLKVDWDDCVIERGDSRRHLPWNIGQFGSNTNFTMARTNFVAAMDAVDEAQGDRRAPLRRRAGRLRRRRRARVPQGQPGHRA